MKKTNQVIELKKVKKVTKKETKELSNPQLIEEPIEEIIDLKELEEKEMKEELKFQKKQEQNKRLWFSCEKKGHFGMMIPARYVNREGIQEKLICPVCGEIMKCNSYGHSVQLAANKE